MSRPGIFESVDRSDVGMIQRRQNFGFALEPRHALGIARESLGQNFQRHIAAEFRVVSAIDLTHASRTEGRDDLI